MTLGVSVTVYLARCGKWYLFFLTAVLAGFAYLYGCSAAMELNHKTSVAGVLSRTVFGVDTMSQEQDRMQKQLSLCAVIAMMLLSVVLYCGGFWVVVAALGWVFAALACCGLMLCVGLLSKIC